MKILVIEDDPTTGDYVSHGLREEGHTVDLIANGHDGLIQATTTDYDVLIVDRMLPELDGVSIVKTLRGAKNLTPVIFLTSLGGVDDRIDGLNAGGDDYLIKPFAFVELQARVEALLRRQPAAADSESTALEVADLKMDLLRRQVSRGGKTIDLQPREFQLLEYLLRHVGQVVTRTMLLEAVWGYHFDPQTNVIDVHMSRLRAKIDKGFAQPLLHTVRGAGYRIEVEQ